MEVNLDELLLVSRRVDPSSETPVAEQALRISVYDEYYAYESYRKIIEKFGQQEPFAHFIEAEMRHFLALEPLLKKYNVPIPINNWDEKLDTPETLLECCEMGVVSEIENIYMYDDLLKYVGEYPDIQDVFYRVQAASYNSHLPRFRACVQEYSIQNKQEVNRQEPNTQQPNGQQENMADANMMGKVNDFRNIATKLSSGKLSQQDMAKVFSNMDMSTIGGLLLGGLGAVQLIKALDKKA